MLSISVDVSGLARLGDRFSRALQSAKSADPVVQGGLPKAHAGHPVPITGAPSFLPLPPHHRSGTRSFGAPSLVSAPSSASSASSSASPPLPPLPLPLQSATAADRVMRSLEALGS